MIRLLKLMSKTVTVQVDLQMVWTQLRRLACGDTNLCHGDELESTLGETKLAEHGVPMYLFMCVITDSTYRKAAFMDCINNPTCSFTYIKRPLFSISVSCLAETTNLTFCKILRDRFGTMTALKSPYFMLKVKYFRVLIDWLKHVWWLGTDKEMTHIPMCCSRFVL